MNRPFGASVHEHGVSFTTWAPAHAEVALVLDEEPDRPMVRDESGIFTLDVPEARPGQRYWYRLKKGRRPDPASRFQPEGPLGPSQIVDTGAFEWTDRGWPGAPPPHRHAIYELHVGTFTAEGTWRAATKWLPLLADLGVTTLQMMPIADFVGRFGWGYDGVSLFAPTRLYGAPHDLQRFVNEAHRLRLAVILDVVYNHFGPVGNFLPEFSPSVRGASGEWGDLLNYDGEGSAQVREFVVQNALYWIREFHFDGFRFDATQSMQDASAEHIISEICRRARAAADPRRLFIVGESEPQDTRLLRETGAYADGLDAIYNEDWHHTAFVALTGRRQAYFTDYQGSTHELAAMARHGPLFQGQWYSWQKQPRGGFALGLPTHRFVNFLENHDQAANTSVVSRLYGRVDAARWRTLTALLLLGPAVPMLFQGQEFASSHPFFYFADHDAELAKAVEDGRLEFLAQFPPMTTPEMRRAVPNPALPQTFERSKLDDAERTADGPWTRLHRDLLRVRREDEVLSESGTERVRIETAAPAEGILLIRSMAEAAERLLIVNLSDDHLSPMNDPLLAPPPSASWAEMWSSEHPCYGGGGATRVVRRGTLAHPRPFGDAARRLDQIAELAYSCDMIQRWSDLKGHHVLVVDDNEDTRQLLGTMLEAHGATVGMAASVAEARTALTARLPDVLITDLAMPVEDGYGLLEYCRQNSDPRLQALPILALTAYGGKLAEDRVLAAGFDAYLAKPVEPSEVGRLVHDLAARRPIS